MGFNVEDVSVRVHAWYGDQEPLLGAAQELVRRRLPRPRPRRHHRLEEVRRLLAAAGDAVASAQDAFRHQPSSPARVRRLFAAEHPLLLVRLATDWGARRGELAVLRLPEQ